MAEVQRRLNARALQARRPDAGAPRPYDAALIPPVTPGPVEKGKIQYKTYEGQWAWVPQFQSLSAKVAGSTDKISADVVAASAGGGASFEGFFQAPADGEYTFIATSDGGAEVFLHDCRVIDDDFARTGAPVAGTIRLAAGWHPLRVYYRHGKDARHLLLEYSGPGIARRALPSSAFAAGP